MKRSNFLLKNDIVSVYAPNFEYKLPRPTSPYFEYNARGRQCRQAMRTRLCGGISADLTFCYFLVKQKVEKKYITNRGFTGHEHYNFFKIINMNGRLYDPVIARFFSPDNFVQLPEFTQSYNRYSYALNCPLMYTDPSGQRFNPIFDKQGDFLGTDDLGIQGEAIIMDRKDFKQGMSHDQALKVGNLRSELPMMINPDIVSKIDNQVASFPNRPDWDGYLTDAEARSWWRNGNGQPLFVDQSKINLGTVSTWNFRNNTTIIRNFFFNLGANENTARVYGTLTLTLLDANTGEVKIGARNTAFIDDYNFNRHEGGNFGRNIATWMARRVVGEGTPFNIYGYGKNPTVFKY